jgi:CheY-like chemotaxis protein
MASILPDRSQNRRRFVLAMAVLAAAFSLSLPTPYAAAQTAARLTQEDREDLKRVAGYFNEIRTLKGRFLQVGPEGNAAEGQIWLRRPGRFRFEFDPPVPLLIVSDIMMDDMDGCELLRLVRTRSAWPVTPFIFVSGKPTFEELCPELDFLPDGYVEKPFTLAQFMTTVRSAITRAPRDD